YRPLHFGRHGFKRPPEVRRTVTTINLKEIEENFERWLAEGKIKEENGVYVVDLRSQGIDKLLGGGKVSRKLRVIVDSCSKQALQKLQAAGGEVGQ
ncbi:MAG: uL15m family ribosomal protein, partial [Thermoplasmata archaeon]